MGSTRWTAVVGLVGMALGAWAGLARAATPVQVEEAINKAKKFLYEQQRDGMWELDPKGDYSIKGRHGGGLTCLATYALVAAGEDPQNPKLTKAIEYLKTADVESIYALGCRAQLWNLLPPTKETKKLAEMDAERIIRQIKAGGEARGLFYYPKTLPNQYDLSISQYGVLGLWASERAGAEVPGKVWEAMDAAWRGQQLPDGGWAYSRHSDSPDNTEHVSTPPIVAAGIATLFITSDVVKANQYVGCAGDREDPNIAKGLAWMTAHFPEVFTGGARGPGVVHYTLYGVERIGVAAGYKYFGKHDWFKEGSDFLVTTQGPAGSWGVPTDVFAHNLNSVPGTSFGLLFLARGRSPVAFNKLKYDPATKAAKSNWNQRPRDCANLTTWMSRGFETQLNWQITNLDAPVDELLEAPILYITGSQELKLTPAQEAKLKAYVEDGGLILGNADCNSKAFSSSFIAMGQRMFSNTEFRELPDDHPIYSNEQYHLSAFKVRPAIQGLSNGSREMMLLLTGDPARGWQTPFDGRLEPYALGSDLLLYAVDKKGLRNRNVTYMVRPNQAAKVTGSMKLARLTYEGNCDPEPGGWRRMAAILRNENQLDLQVEPVALGTGKLCEATPPAPTLSEKELRTAAFKRISPDKIAETAGDTAKIEDLIKTEMKNVEAELVKGATLTGKSLYVMAHLTGSGKVAFNEAQVKEVRDFVNGGGTLLVDASGGSTEFAESVESALEKAFGADAGGLRQPLTPEHALFAHLPGAGDLFREYAKKRISTSRSPRVRGLVVNNRLGVMYSPEDLSTGLVGQSVDGVVGYTPAVATQIVRNAILMAAKR